jgi:hypothetical protein
MENLTHTLVGTVIGKSGFEKKAQRAVPLLVLAANLPLFRSRSLSETSTR